MTRQTWALALAACAWLGAGSALAATPAAKAAAQAPAKAAATLHVVDVRIPAVPPVSRNGVAFFSVHNAGSKADVLTGVESPIADTVELHAMEMRGALVGMSRVRAITVPAGGHVELVPGGRHVMLIGLRKPLVAGDRVPLTLVFRDAGRVAVEAQVHAVDGKAEAAGAHEHAH